MARPSGATGQPGTVAGSLPAVSGWRGPVWLTAAAALALALIVPAFGVGDGTAAGRSVAAPAAPAPLVGQCPASGARCTGGHLVPTSGTLTGGLLCTALLGVAVTLRRRRDRRRRGPWLLADGVPALVLRPPRTFLAGA